MFSSGLSQSERSRVLYVRVCNHSQLCTFARSKRSSSTAICRRHTRKHVNDCVRYSMNMRVYVWCARDCAREVSTTGDCCPSWLFCAQIVVVCSPSSSILSGVEVLSHSATSEATHLVSFGFDSTHRLYDHSICSLSLVGHDNVQCARRVQIGFRPVSEQSYIPVQE